MIYQFKKKITNYALNNIGWKTNRKIVVIESDDWGMIRMKSPNAYESFLKKGYEVNKCTYNKNDSIESNDDLIMLFDVLNSVKDSKGNPAIFTANNIVANPNFEKIKSTNFQEYHFEPFTETLKRYPNRENVFELYKEGISSKIFYPQFHGREHVNINRWMAGLMSGNQVLLDAFSQNMFSVHKSGKISGRLDYLDAFGMAYEKEWLDMESIISSGLSLFKTIWGYPSKSFIAPCYIWPSFIEPILHKNGVKYIQGSYVQNTPLKGTQLKSKRKYHYLGQKNKIGQYYLIRNVTFEPSENSNLDSEIIALNEIDLAFKNNKPAIISSHRVNYIGSLDIKNRDFSLKLLRRLLKKIVEKYPEVEFMTSDQIGDLIME
jgi:hypothetical protein